MAGFDRLRVVGSVGWLGAGLMVALLSVSAPREAEAAGIPVTQATEEQRKQAQVLFKSANEKSKKKDYRGAIADLRSSFDLVASPNTKLRISQELSMLGKWADAYREALAAVALAEEAARIDPKYEAARKEAKAGAETLLEKVGFVVVDLGPLTGELLVAGRTVPKAQAGQPIVVDPGTVDVLVRNPSGTRSSSVTVAAGETETVTLVDEATAVLPKREKPPLTPFDMGGGQQITGVVFGAVGGVGLILFSALGIANVAMHNDVSKQCPGGRCPTSLRGDVETGQSLQLGANVCAVIGAIGLTAGAAFIIPTLFASSGTSIEDAATEPRVGVRVGPTGASLSVEF